MTVNRHAKLSVAPMMDWTDRHCRYLHRLLSRDALLYTEMVTAPALVRGGALHLLEYTPEEHPVALQLGGSDPAELAQAAKLGAEAGYDEINLNVGCPSDRVQSGTFGAVLMKNPGLVAEDIVLARSGQAALIRAAGDTYVLWVMGQDVATHNLARARVTEAPEGVTLRLPDFAAPKVTIHLTDDEKRTWLPLIEAAN